MIRPVSLTQPPAPPATSSLRHMAPPGATTTDVYVGSTPAPEVTAPQPDEAASHAGRALKMAAVVGLALAGVGFLAGCTTSAPPPSSSVVTEHYTAGDFAVEAIPEGFQRIDVVRGTHTEKVEDQTLTVNNDYAPFGVYLGDGLFYDTNGNLVLVPQRAFEGPAVPADSSQVKVDPPGSGNTTKAVFQADGDVQIKIDGFGNDFTIHQDGARFTIDPAGWGGSTRITRDGNDTVIDPAGWGNDLNLKRSEGQVQVDPAGWNNTTNIQLGQDRIKLDPAGWRNETVITRAGSTIKIDPEGWGNETTITRSGSVTRIKHPGLGGETVLKHEGNRIVIDPVGWGDQTVVEWKD